MPSSALLDRDRVSSASVHQASALPFRRRGRRVEFCVITSSAGRWGFPKGLIAPGETLVDTALKEALEEAGLRGRILGDPLGCYQITKRGRDMTVVLFLMDVTKCKQKWEEKDCRKRRWVTVEEARQMLGMPQLREYLEAAVARITR